MKKLLVSLTGLLLLITSCTQKTSRPEFNSQSIALNEKAMQLIRTAKYDSALIFLNKALEIDKGFYPAYGNKILIYNTRGDYKNSLAIAGEMVTSAPGNANAWVLEGILYDATGDPVKATECYNKGLSLYNDELSKTSDEQTIRNDKFNRAFALILLGKELEAQAALEEFKVLYPSDQLVNNQLIDTISSFTKNDILKYFAFNR
jgi:tetratricopeptide (TPR) repeat protein